MCTSNGLDECDRRNRRAPPMESASHVPCSDNPRDSARAIVSGRLAMTSTSPTASAISAIAASSCGSRRHGYGVLVESKATDQVVKFTESFVIVNPVIDIRVSEFTITIKRMMATDVADDRSEDIGSPLPSDRVQCTHRIDRIEKIVVVQRVARQRQFQQATEDLTRRRGARRLDDRPVPPVSACRFASAFSRRLSAVTLSTQGSRSSNSIIAAGPMEGR